MGVVGRLRMNWVLMGSQGPSGSQAEPFYSVAQPCLWAEVVLASSDMILGPT